MGSPLSPFLAEIFMSNLELKISSNSLFDKHILFWARYVDDIFVVFSGSDKDIDNFLQFINSLHNRIKFTVEIGDNSINFLDLSILIISNNFSFSIYRKSTCTNNIINYYSNCHLKNILAFFNTCFFRLFNIPLNDIKFQKEFNIILQIEKEKNFLQKLYVQFFKNFTKKVILNPFLPFLQL